MKQRIKNILKSVLLNEEGNASLSEEHSNINDAFWKWFEGSKVVDIHGEPLMVYRGDRPNKSSFTGREDSSNYIQGNIFFTSDPKIGRFYTKHRTNYMLDPSDIDESDGLYRVYLSMKKPLIVDAKGEDWSMIPFNGETKQIDDLAVFARQKGYDGLIVKNVWDQAGDGDQYIVFNTEQIKSIFNHGTWDGNNPDIME